MNKLTVAIFYLILLPGFLDYCTTPAEVVKDQTVNQGRMTVQSGETFTIHLASLSGPLPPEHRYDRLTPEISGESIRFISRRDIPAPQEIIGSGGHEEFVFEGVQKGEAVIRIRKKPIDPTHPLYAEQKKTGEGFEWPVDFEVTVIVK